ncbi:formyltetrahydrofolate deformylase [Nakamurella flavida]|uniref:Formyltetrahydrofolate deformylase n=1 Tax=Nakamurella flavida TaxID=363630 RepID=A0A938YCM8_9ACTN|nr:formyltetrahydrofolate deformylase [Nakamurella flavida]MBM9475206.1 formyltetrahydrofolate deformylase [Nakamurella flavida]
MSPPTREPGRAFVLTLSCADRRGIVWTVAGFLADQGCTILDSQQFGDASTGQFFMRVHLRSEVGAIEVDDLRARFDPVATEFAMTYQLADTARPARLVVMVSQQGHCLNDLLFRSRSGALPAEIVAVVSNHRDFEDLVTWHGLPFHHIPVTADTKQAAEDDLRAVVARYEADTIVLARYMQVLSDRLCGDFPGRIINIHHSLLPSFKGARPYAQAYARGVKVIGATAHYVTAALDEGPIIEQDFVRVDHAHGPAELTARGRDLEAMALARAVTWHAERRVLLYAGRTIVFA